MASTPEDKLRGFPWSTYGRREGTDEVMAKCWEQRGRVALLRRRPRISLIVSAGDAPPATAETLVASLQLQSYPYWEAVFVVPAGNKAAWRKALDAWEDARLRVEAAPEASHWGAVRTAAERALGEWVGFLDADTVLSPAALYLLVAELQSDDAPVALYWNAARVDSARKRVTERVSRCGWSPFTLWHTLYMGPDWIVRRDRLQTFSDELAGCGEAWQLGLWLKLAQARDTVTLIPACLAYRRGPISTEVAGEEAVRLVGRHLEAEGISATVRRDASGGIQIQPTSDEPPQVTVIIPFRNRSEWTIRCANSLVSHAGGAKLELLLVDNRSGADERAKVVDAAKRIGNFARVVSYDGEFNFAELHNQIVREHARGDVLLLLNNDVFWSRGSVAELACWASLPWVGTVGMPLRYENGSLQHGGMIAEAGGASRLARVRPQQSETAYVKLSREVFANTFAACLTRRSVFDEVGGLRAYDLANGFGDVAYSFECVRHGYRNLFVTSAEGIHLESASRGVGYEYWEERVLERDYPEVLQRMVREDLRLEQVAGLGGIAEAVKGLTAEFLREHVTWWSWARPRLKSATHAIAGARQWLSRAGGKA